MKHTRLTHNTPYDYLQTHKTLCGLDCRKVTCSCFREDITCKKCLKSTDNLIDVLIMDSELL